MAEIEKTEEIWDKKKIAVFVGIILVLVVGIAYFSKDFLIEQYLQKIRPQLGGEKKAVKSAQTRKNTLRIREDLEERLNAIRKDVEAINFEEIATSSPKVQKVVNDIKALQEYPHEQAKDLCVKMCSSF